jgi:hypothetical protein
VKEKLYTILNLPERTLVNKRLTKAFFKRNFDLTLSEKSLLDDYSTVIGFDWLASISHNTANIAAYQDATTTFEEVQVISVEMGSNDFERNSQRVAEMVQKYIPYHLLLCIYSGDQFLFNTCEKRINQNDSSRRTIEKRYFTESIKEDDVQERQEEFLASLSFDKLDKTDLKTFYNSYSQRIVALQTAAVSGLFVPRSQSRTEADMAYLENIDILTKEIAVIQSKAKKETQLAVRVQLNTEIQQKRKEIEQLKKFITA